jgi:phage head maturation protease
VSELNRPPWCGIEGAPQTMTLIDPAGLRFPEKLVLVGLCVPFNVPVDASSRWGGRWQFRAGSFARAIRERPIALQLMHHDSLVVASTSDGSLSVWEGPAGVMFRLNPPEALAGREVLRHALAHAYVGASISFRPDDSISVDAGYGLSIFTHVDGFREISLIGKHSIPRFAATWIKVMTWAAAWHLEQEAWVSISMKSTRQLTHAGRDRCFYAGVTYSVPIHLAETLVSLGVATRRKEP